MSLLSINPLVWLSSWRTVIRLPYGRRPGSQRSTVSSSSMRPSPTSCRIRVAVHALPTLSSRMRASTGIRRPVSTFEYPADPAQLPRGPDTKAVTPGATCPRPVTRPSRIRWSSGRADARSAETSTLRTTSAAPAKRSSASSSAPTRRRLERPGLRIATADTDRTSSQGSLDGPRPPSVVPLIGVLHPLICRAMRSRTHTVSVEPTLHNAAMYSAAMHHSESGSSEPHDG